MSAAALVTVIRAKLGSNALPTSRAERLWAGRGSGKTCDACDRPIDANEIEWEAELSDGRLWRFHRSCLDAWDRERVDPRGGRD